MCSPGLFMFLINELHLYYGVCLYLSRIRVDRGGTTDDLATNSLHLSLFSASLRTSLNLKSVHFQFYLPISSSVCLSSSLTVLSPLGLSWQVH